MADPDARPDLSRADVFSFGPVRQEGSKGIFAFTCGRHGAFEEVVDFGTEDTFPEALLTLLQVALGVSTYKAAAARRVLLPELTPAGRAMAEALYTSGLAEFFVRSGLPYPPQTEFVGDIADGTVASTPHTDLHAQPLVAFGGGKDSYVAGAIARRATGTDPAFASVILSDAVGEVLTRTAPYPLLLIKRSLDPKLLGLKDAFSGHVPITAINILVLTIVGMLRGSGPVLFANERSADEPTMSVNGTPANHQYSKSSAFEALVRSAVSEVAPESPPTYSALRPFSELWIAKRFAAMDGAFERFTSCNRNFRLAGDADKRWCGACAKCAFTSLIVSPFLSRDQSLQIFGDAFLDRPSLQGFYRELCGLGEHKPWDCVGTIDECQGALYLLAQYPDWAQTEAVRTLLPEVLAMKPEDVIRTQIKEAFTPRERGALPDMYHQAALEIPCA